MDRISDSLAALDGLIEAARASEALLAAFQEEFAAGAAMKLAKVPRDTKEVLVRALHHAPKITLPVSQAAHGIVTSPVDNLVHLREGIALLDCWKPNGASAHDSLPFLEKGSPLRQAIARYWDTQEPGAA